MNIFKYISPRSAQREADAKVYGGGSAAAANDLLCPVLCEDAANPDSGAPVISDRVPIYILSGPAHFKGVFNSFI